MNIVQVILPEDCRAGLCDCASAKQCHFDRCKNCDEITKDGKWIDDNGWHGEHPDWCPECSAPIKPIR